MRKTLPGAAPALAALLVLMALTCAGAVWAAGRPAAAPTGLTTSKHVVVSATATGAGTITPSGDIQVSYGYNATFTMEAQPGNHLAEVLVDGTSVGTPRTYTFYEVTKNHTIYAMFVADGVVITASAGPHGSISPSGDVQVAMGADQKFTITPDAGYKVADVLVDGKSVGAVTTYTFSKVAVSHTIAASFTEAKVVITAGAGPHGSIAPSGQVQVSVGADQTFTITPDAGYKVADVLVDGASVGAVAAYTFRAVTASHTIAASFAAVPPPIVKLSPFLTPGLIIGKGFEEQVLFTVRQVPASQGGLLEPLLARAVSPPLDVTVTVLEPGATETTAVAVSWSTLPDGSVAASGTLPTEHSGEYVLTVAYDSPGGGSGTSTASYAVSGYYAPVQGLPASGSVDVGSGSPTAKKSFPLRIRLRNDKGGPVLKAKPKLYIYDLATGVRVFKAGAFFKNLGGGRYGFTWYPKKMKPFAAWKGTTRTAQLVIPLYTAGAKKGSKTMGDITVKW
jgi:hypothetical protein